MDVGSVRSPFRAHAKVAQEDVSEGAFSRKTDSCSGPVTFRSTSSLDSDSVLLARIPIVGGIFLSLDRQTALQGKHFASLEQNVNADQEPTRQSHPDFVLVHSSQQRLRPRLSESVSLEETDRPLP